MMTAPVPMQGAGEILQLPKANYRRHFISIKPSTICTGVAWRAWILKFSVLNRLSDFSTSCGVHHIRIYCRLQGLG